MKILKNIALTILLINLFTCNRKPEPNLQLFNPEAFAFNVVDTWEVNATVNAKGFLQNEKDDTYSLSLSYSVDLITPEKDTLKKIFIDSLVNKQEIEFADVPIEAQIELDTTFALGNYKLIFNVTDELSKQEKSAEVIFSLTAD